MPIMYDIVIVNSGAFCYKLGIFRVRRVGIVRRRVAAVKNGERMHEGRGNNVLLPEGFV